MKLEQNVADFFEQFSARLSILKYPSPDELEEEFQNFFFQTFPNLQ